MNIVFQAFSPTFASTKIIDPQATLEELTFNPLTDLASPAATDLLIVELAAGGKRKVEIQNLPTGGTVADDSITNLKLANMAANTVKARQSSSGDPQDLAVPVNTLLGHTTASAALAALTPAEVKVLLGYMTEVLDDATPQLGGDIDFNGHKAIGLSGEQFFFSSGSAYVKLAASQEFGIQNSSAAVRAKIVDTGAFQNASNVQIGKLGVTTTPALTFGTADEATITKDIAANDWTFDHNGGKYFFKETGTTILTLDLGNSEIACSGLSLNVTNLGFYGTAGQPKPTITGSRSSNAALADLLTDLATLGLITDSTIA